MFSFYLFDVQVVQLTQHHRHKNHRDHLNRQGFCGYLFGVTVVVLKVGDTSTVIKLGVIPTYTGLVENQFTDHRQIDCRALTIISTGHTKGDHVGIELHLRKWWCRQLESVFFCLKVKTTISWTSRKWWIETQSLSVCWSSFLNGTETDQKNMK